MVSKLESYGNTDTKDSLWKCVMFFGYMILSLYEFGQVI